MKKIDASSIPDTEELKPKTKAASGAKKAEQTLKAAKDSLEKTLLLRNELLEPKCTAAKKKHAQGELRAAADGKDAAAMTELAKLLVAGSGGFEKDEKEGVDLLFKARELGYARASYALGELYEDGKGGLAKNEARAVDLYAEAADRGYDAAHMRLGFILLAGACGLDQDKERARKHFELAAECGDEGAYCLARRLLLAKDKGDQERGLAMLTELADRGHARAMLEAGVRLAARRGDAKARKHGAKLLEQAAELDVPGGRLALGAYMAGKKDSASVMTGFGLISKERKTNYGAYCLGLLHLRGATGLQKNGKKGIDYLKGLFDDPDCGKAAKMHSMDFYGSRDAPGDADRANKIQETFGEDVPTFCYNSLALFNLRSYSCSWMVPELRHLRCSRVLEHSAKRGDVFGLTALGECKLGWYAGARKEEEAEELLKRACDLGSGEAALALSVYYATGDKNKKESEAYLEKAKILAPKALNLRGRMQGYERDSVWRAPKPTDTLKDCLESLGSRLGGEALSKEGDLRAIVGLSLLLLDEGGYWSEDLPQQLKKAAEDGYPPAQMALGIMYKEGYLSFEKDEKLAKAWMGKANKNGNKNARAQRQEKLSKDAEEEQSWDEEPIEDKELAVARSKAQAEVDACNGFSADELIRLGRLVYEGPHQGGLAKDERARLYFEAAYEKGERLSSPALMALTYFHDPSDIEEDSDFAFAPLNDAYARYIKDGLPSPFTKEEEGKILYALSSCHLYGIGTPKAKSTGLAFLEKAATAGNLDAQAALAAGRIYSKNKKESALAVKQLQDLADKGSARACLDLGAFYEEQDQTQQAIDVYYKGAKYKEPAACFRLATSLLEQSPGGDPTEAFHFLTLAKEGGYPEAYGLYAVVNRFFKKRTNGVGLEGVLSTLSKAGIGVGSGNCAHKGDDGKASCFEEDLGEISPQAIFDEVFRLLKLNIFEEEEKKRCCTLITAACERMGEAEYGPYLDKMVDRRLRPAEILHGMLVIQSLADSGMGYAQALLAEQILAGYPADIHEKESPQKQAIRLFEKAVASGSARAAASYGNKLYRGEFGLPINIKKGLRLLEEGAEKGNVLAMTAIGSMCMNGQGMKPDAKRGLNLLERAAEGGMGEAFAILGQVHQYGQMVEPDLPKAVEYYKQGAEKDDRHCLYALGDLMLTGAEGCLKADPKQGVQLLKKAAALGSPFARKDLAGCYLNGIGCKVDLDLAEGYVRPLLDDMEYQDAEDYSLLAEILLARRDALTKSKKGKSTPELDEEIFSTLERAMELDPMDDIAVTCLSRCYTEGIGTPVDVETAEQITSMYLKGLLEETGDVPPELVRQTAIREFELIDMQTEWNNIKKAVRLFDKVEKKLKDGFGYYLAGMCCARRDIEERDMEQAAKYLKASYEKGQLLGTFSYGELLFTLDDEAKKEEGVKLIQKAAEAGLATAQMTMGLFCSHSNPYVDFDLKAALSWFSKASKQGLPEAKEFMVETRKRMANESKKRVLQ